MTWFISGDSWWTTLYSGPLNNNNIIKLDISSASNKTITTTTQNYNKSVSE